MGAAGFARLQRERLYAAWEADRPGSHAPRVVITLPSYSLDRSVYEHFGARLGPLEHRYLYIILRASQPGARVIYFSSRPVPDYVVDGYLGLVPASTRELVRRNSLLLSPDDPSPRPLADKIIENRSVLDAARQFVGNDEALLEPWNVTECERELALALDAPMNGTDPALRSLGTKSAARKLFRAAGVPTPPGVEDVTTPEAVVAAVHTLRAANPGLAGVVVKLDDSVSGDGNVVLRFDGLVPGDEPATAGLVARSLPDWYVTTLRDGGIVEELIVGDDFSSPSGQGELRPDGVVDVLATHDQRLGGEDGQVYEGCTFPARAAYAATITSHVQAVGNALCREGAIGRFAVDFAVVRRGTNWDVFALEINLRKGGTTHPFGVSRLLTGGKYDVESEGLLLSDGTTRCYGATDNLMDPAWRDRSAEETRHRLASAGVEYDRAERTGVIPHLLDCLPIDGRMGYTAIGRSREHVQQLEQRLEEALRS